MKHQNLYSVTVYGTYSRDVLVFADSEIEALDYVQDICDKTSMFGFSESDLVELEAGDVVNLSDCCDGDCANCPACEKHAGVAASQTPKKVPSGSGGPSLLRTPTPDSEAAASPRPVNDSPDIQSLSIRLKRLLTDVLCVLDDASADLDDDLNALRELLDDCRHLNGED